MRSISRNYEEIQAKNPSMGAYPSLARIVKHRKFSRKSLVKNFNDLIPKSDYAESEKKVLIDNLESLTNMPVEG